MSQNLTLKQITNKISYLEQEMNTLRKELDELREQKANIPTTSVARVAYAWADKEAQRRWSSQLFTSLSITTMPISTRALQQRMIQSGIGPDELSRSIVEARED